MLLSVWTWNGIKILPQSSKTRHSRACPKTLYNKAMGGTQIPDNLLNKAFEGRCNKGWHNAFLKGCALPSCDAGIQDGAAQGMGKQSL
eukprot:5710347-Amphidinium_carterae.1